MEAVRSQCGRMMKIKDLESQGQVQHYKEKWKAEFERRKKLHNTVKARPRTISAVILLLAQARASSMASPGVVTNW